MEKCKWRATFNIKPSLSKSESLEGFDFERLSNGVTIVTCEYETLSYTEKHPHRSAGYEYAEQTLAKQDAQILQGMLLKRMIYQRYFSPISVELIERPLLTNRDALSSQGLLGLRTVGSLHIDQYPLLDTGDSLEESQLFWDRGFNHVSKGQQAEVLRIADWIEKSYAEHDDIQSFILAWIAFNGLYGLFCDLTDKTKKLQADKFEYTIQELCNPFEANRIMQQIATHAASLSRFNITSKNGGILYSSKLKELIDQENSNSVEALKYVAQCIYDIRNQVFHEARSTGDIPDRVKTAKLALLPIVETCLKTFISNVKI